MTLPWASRNASSALQAGRLRAQVERELAIHIIVPAKRGLWLRLVGVGLVALLLRLLALPVVARPELAFSKYPSLALDMLHGRGQALTAFSASPLYLYFWMAIHQVFPGFVGAAILVQMALGTLTCIGVAMVVECWGGPRAGLLGGLAAACYLPFIVNDASFVSEGLVLLCNTAALLGLGRLQQRPTVGWAVCAGTAIGLSGMARPNILLFLPFAAAAVWWGVTGSRQQRLRLLSLVTGLALAGPLLVTLRNAAVSGQPVLVMSDSGIVLYIGNNELDSGLSYVWPRHESLLLNRPGEVDPTHRIAQEIAERESGRALGPHDCARFWTHEALRFPRQHPLEYAGLLLRKLRYTWAAVEAHDVQTTFAQEQALRRWPLLRFAWVGPLALTGLGLTYRRWRALLPLYGLLLTYSATGMLFTVVARYRLPMMPACFAFACLALAGLTDQARRRQWHVLAGSLLALTLAAVAVNVEDYHTRNLVTSNRVAIATLNRADAWVNAGDLPRARALYEQILKDQPTFGLLTQARYGMVIVAMGRGDEAAAATWRDAALGPRLPRPALVDAPERDSLRRRVQANSDDVEAWLFLGAWLWQEERFAESEAAFRQVTRRIPAFATGHLNRAWCLLRLGRLAEARRWAEAARRLQPELPDTHVLILDVARAQGRLADLLPEYERLARLYPEIRAYQKAFEAVRAATRSTHPPEPAGPPSANPEPGSGEAP